MHGYTTDPNTPSTDGLAPAGSSLVVSSGYQGSSSNDVSRLHRYYFDSNVWDLISSHPETIGVERYISKPGRRMAVLSMLTAAEVLRISDETKRRQVCSTIMAVFDPSHPLVGAPMTVLREAALAKRQGDAVLLNLRQEEDVLPLLDRLREPDSVTAQDQQQLAAWVADQKRGFEAFWKEVSANRDPNLTIDLDFLEHPGLADMIVKSPPAELEMTHDEVRRLFRETAVWGAFGAQVGLSIELAHRHKYSTKKGRLLPGGPDFYQFTYLGLVNEFVTDDQEFLDVAIRGAEMLKRWTGHAVKVSSARSFFNRIGFEHPLRPSTWGRS